MVPGTGFEPVISAVRGRCPRPLDEPGTFGANLLNHKPGFVFSEMSFIEH